LDLTNACCSPVSGTAIQNNMKAANASGEKKERHIVSGHVDNETGDRIA
jgi:hypothetical protein